MLMNLIFKRRNQDKQKLYQMRYDLIMSIVEKEEKLPPGKVAYAKTILGKRKVTLNNLRMVEEMLKEEE